MRMRVGSTTNNGAIVAWLFSLSAAALWMGSALGLEVIGDIPPPAVDVFDEGQEGSARIRPRSTARPEIANRIVGGTDAPPGRYPYYAYIEARTDQGTFVCSAVVIWEDILLSSAHCYRDLISAGLTVQGFDAWVGLENQKRREQAQFRQIELIVPHPEYNSITQQNDIMIMKMLDPVTNVQPVQLNTLSTLPSDGQRVDVFGFGVTSEDSPDLPDQLQTVDIQKIPFADCNDANSYNGTIFDDVMICAGAPGGGKDSCVGDSGSPLIVPGSSAAGDVVVGLVSFGAGCARRDFPGVYARVSRLNRFAFNQICAWADAPPGQCASAPFVAPNMSPVQQPSRQPSGGGPAKGGKKGGGGKGGGGKGGGKKRRLTSNGR